MNYEDVSFKTADSLTLRVAFIHPLKRPDKTLILLHGYPRGQGKRRACVRPSASRFQPAIVRFPLSGSKRRELFHSRRPRRLAREFRRGLPISQNERGRRWAVPWATGRGFDGHEKATRDQSGHRQSNYASLAHMALELFRIPLLNYPVAYLIGLWAKLFLGIDLRDVSPAERVRTYFGLPILLIHSSGDAGDPILPRTVVAGSAEKLIPAPNFGSTRNPPMVS